VQDLLHEPDSLGGPKESRRDRDDRCKRQKRFTQAGGWFSFAIQQGARLRQRHVLGEKMSELWERGHRFVGLPRRAGQPIEGADGNMSTRRPQVQQKLVELAFKVDQRFPTSPQRRYGSSGGDARPLWKHLAPLDFDYSPRRPHEASVNAAMILSTFSPLAQPAS
jgi:hypothetical protein